jgi:hypothetical protein
VKPAKEATANDGIMPEGKWPHGLNGKHIVIFKLGNLWAFKQFFDERNGFDYDLVENLKGYLVTLPKSVKYAQILKNSVAFKETADERIFLMKDLAALEEAINFGAKIYEGEISF